MRTAGCIFIVGPTAAGKSALAMRVAEKVGGEIISVDSMQVYRGLDVGTAKPTRIERAQVPHYGIDVIDLDEAFDASRFVQLAQAAVADIQSRGRVPVFCGGTGLYFKAYIEGIGKSPPSDPKIRAELEAAPLPQLLEELAKKDPLFYEKIDRQNARRVYRALEVIRLTNRPYSEQRAQWSKAGAPEEMSKLEETKTFGLEWDNEELDRRIHQRVDRMFESGLVAETEFLLTRGLESNRTAMQAIGYRQVVEHLRGGPSLPETVDLIKQRTRQFARRQMKWFRRQLRVDWTPLASEADLGNVATRIGQCMTR